MDHHYNIEQQSSLPAAPRATNVGNAPYAKTVWNKKGLIWLWVLQMLCLLAHLGIEILWAAFTAWQTDADHVDGARDFARCIVFIIFDGFFIALIVLHIVRYKKGRLTPFAMLVTSALASVYWTANGLFEILVVALPPDYTGYRGHYEGGDGVTVIDMSLALAVMLTFYAGLIYSAILYRRQRRSRLADSRVRALSLADM